MQESGIAEAHDRFYELPWSQFFETSQEVTVFVSYARTWRNRFREQIKTFLGRSKCRLRIILPDPSDENTMSELGRRFNCEPEEIQRRINESKTEYLELAKEVGKQAEGRLAVRFLPGITPHATFYLFDHVAVMALYTHSREKKPVPCFVFSHKKVLYEFVKTEVEAIIASSIDLEQHLGETDARPEVQK